MKKALKALLCLLLVLVMCISAVPAGAEFKGVIILFTNDVHCAIDGYSALAAYRAQLIESGYTVITVDIGDAIQGEAIGTLTEGQAVVDLMETVGYDIAIPGNHEYDFGMDVFLDIAQNASFEYISSNFVSLEDGTTILSPAFLYDAGEMQIGFVGITTPETYTKSTPTFFQDEDGNYIYGFSSENLYEVVQDAVDGMYVQGADVIVALGHTGIEGVTEGWLSTDIIANTTGIDVYLDGHSHEVYTGSFFENKDGEEVILASTGTKFQFVGQVNIAPDGRMNTELVMLNTVDPSAMGSAAESAYNTVQDKIDGYNDQIAYLYEVIGYSETKLAINDANGDRIIRNSETNMGNFVADAYRDYTGADIAIANGGGIRAEIEEGDVTRLSVMNINPWNNAMCVIEATGQEILYMLECAVSDYPVEKGAFLHTSGLTFELHSYVESAVVFDGLGNFVSLNPEASRRVRNVKVNGEYIVLDKVYTLAGSRYVLTEGGDGLTMFNGANVVQSEGLPCDADMLVEYLKGTLNGRITAAQYEGIYGEGRISIVSDIAGDTNGDGTVNSLDAAKVLQYDAMLISLSEGVLAVANVNGDGVVNSLDAAKILQYDAGLITEF